MRLGALVELIIKTPTLSPALCLYDDIDDPVVSRFRWHLVCNKPWIKLYAVAYIGGRMTFMHRLILANACEGFQVDHINGNGLDNRRENLRVCTRFQNMQNSSGCRDRKSAYKGVAKISRWATNKNGKIWEARICWDGKQRVIGTYKTELDAAQAYDNKAREVHAQFARLNFPHQGERGIR